MNTKIILGSGSPRRKELLANLGFTFEIRTKDTDESYSSKMTCEEVPTFLAKQKANALLPELTSDELLICADTVVTGVFIGNNEKQLIFSEKTAVTFNKLSQSDINYYIDNYQPFDKAGSYGIQEWIGAIGITNILGSYSNVIGLPTHKVYELLTTDFQIKIHSISH